MTFVQAVIINHSVMLPISLYDMDINHNLYRCDTVENEINRLAIIFIFTIVVLIHCMNAVLDILLRPLIHVQYCK